MLELIQSRGYSGTGLNTVTEHAGAPKGSLYFHFPEGKEALGEKALELATEQFRVLIAEAVRIAETPADVVHQVIDVVIRILETSDFQLGCPVSVVTLEMGGHSERLRKACSDAFNAWVNPFADYLTSHGHPQPQATMLAASAVSMVEGATILSRAQRSTQPLRDAATALTTLLDNQALRTARQQ